MKFSVLASTGAALLIAVSSCGPAGSGTGTGGSSGVGTGGAGTGGASTGTGGTSSGSGGASTGTGGAGTGGASTGTGGAATGTGGASTGTGGDSTGTGGTATGTGGRGTGGAAGGGTGTGGRGTGTGGSATGGASGTGGAGGSTDLLSIVGAWDGALVTYPCNAAGSSYDCPNVGCSGNMVTKTNMWTIGGTTGTIYNVTFNVRGIVEPYAYVGGTRDGGSITTNPDLFQVGGMAQGSGGANYDYNTYQLDVTPAVAGATANTYFLNSVMASEGPHAANPITSHLTYPINYTKTIPVPGGGKVTLKVFDSNCTQVKNCGPTTGNTCAAPRTVSLAGTTPAAPTSFMQPYQMPANGYAQWVFFDITNVTVRP